jgi:hypothetical protein
MVFDSLIELYEKTGMYDQAELFAREALNNMVIHEDDRNKKLVFETKFSSNLARILIWQARHPSDRPIESREALLDEADALYKRSFDILSGGLIDNLPTSASVEPIVNLTRLMIDRLLFTPVSGHFLRLEMDILLRDDADKDGKEFLRTAVSLVMTYADTKFSASCADHIACCPITFDSVRGSTGKANFTPDQIVEFAEKGLKYCRYRRYYEGSGVVKLLTEVLSRIKSGSNGQI